MERASSPLRERDSDALRGEAQSWNTFVHCDGSELDSDERLGCSVV